MRPDHVVVTGDHTHDELPETYAAVRELLEPFLDRLWLLPGNHDDRAVLRAAFDDRIPLDGADRITFSFRAGDWLCLGLDTHVPGAVSGRTRGGSGRMDPRAARRAPPASGRALHAPPAGRARAGLARPHRSRGRRTCSRSLLVEEPRIRLVCCGHVHHESSHRVGAAEIVTVPSTGLQFSPTGDVAEFVTAPPGYRLIELGDDGYSTTVVRLPEARYAPTQP